MDENNGNEDQITNTTPFVQETDNIESKDVGHVENKKLCSNKHKKIIIFIALIATAVSVGIGIYFSRTQSENSEWHTVTAPIKNAASIKKIFFEPIHYGAFHLTLFTHIYQK